MTTIVGVQYPDYSVIAVDSRVTDDDGRIYSHPDMMKYAERGAFVIAGSGEVLPCDIVQNMWTPPRLLAADKANIYKFMITKVMPSLREVLSKNGYNFDEAHDKKEGERFHFLISCNGELFDVDQELSVTRDARGYYAIGSGGNYALGALCAGATPLKSLEIAASVSVYTAAPFYEIEQYKN